MDDSKIKVNVFLPAEVQYLLTTWAKEKGHVHKRGHLKGQGNMSGYICDVLTNFTGVMSLPPEMRKQFAEYQKMVNKKNAEESKRK